MSAVGGRNKGGRGLISDLHPARDKYKPEPLNLLMLSYSSRPFYVYLKYKYTCVTVTCPDMESCDMHVICSMLVNPPVPSMYISEW